MSDDIFSVEDLPELNARALFVTDSSAVFREDSEIYPVTVADDMQYMPWGASNNLPYKILDLFEQDETLSACQMFNSEVVYAGGLRYETTESSNARLSRDIERFFLNNDIPAYFLGTCKDLKYFEFAVTVIIFSLDGEIVTNIFRKDVINCRFAPAEPDGHIPYVLYGKWRRGIDDPKKIEKIDVIDSRCPLDSIESLLKRGIRKMAFVTRIPKVENFYYPVPDYASLFRGKWFNIKRYIGAAKEAKLRNSAPLKYLVEISTKYYDEIFKREGILDPQKKGERIIKAKREIIEFLTGAENSGKALFSDFMTSPDGKEFHLVKITKIENNPQGGDWETDHQEAVNMMCFAMRVHSNLVGSVPGKAQSNNSGSDKRELYTIAQAVQRPYHDLIFRLHELIININGWNPAKPVVPYIQLTTLDEHKDFKEVRTNE